MENTHFQGFARDRRSRGNEHGTEWTLEDGSWGLDSGLVRLEVPNSLELIAVAHAATTWWEKHKHDTMIEDGQEIFRYEFKPVFVSRAQEILKRAASLVVAGGR